MNIGDKIQAGSDILILHGVELEPPIRAGDWFIITDVYEDQFFEIEKIESGEKYQFFTSGEIDVDFLTISEIRKLKLKKIEKKK